MRAEKTRMFDAEQRGLTINGAVDRGEAVL
jgi:hypothetical protein